MYIQYIRIGLPLISLNLNAMCEYYDKRFSCRAFLSKVSTNDSDDVTLKLINVVLWYVFYSQTMFSIVMKLFKTPKVCLYVRQLKNNLISKSPYIYSRNEIHSQILVSNLRNCCHIQVVYDNCLLILIIIVRLCFSAIRNE